MERVLKGAKALIRMDVVLIVDTPGRVLHCMRRTPVT
jgi:hypothetical protein